MHTILGGTGHVGSAVAAALLVRGEAVTVLTHDSRKEVLSGAKAAVVDLDDVAALADVLARGRTAFLLMPPAAPSTDTVAVEAKTVANIVAAVARAKLEKVVVESTYGAQSGTAIGDLGSLYELEQGIKALDVRASILRGAYYMTNWDAALKTAREEGVVHTMFPPDFRLPMVAPADIGPVAARLLTDDVADAQTHYIEGPSEYSSNDVAKAFAKALGRDVKVESTPRDKWQSAFRALGFSEAAAKSYTNMTALVVDGKVQHPTAAEHGPTTLEEYIRKLVGSV